MHTLSIPVAYVAFTAIAFAETSLPEPPALVSSNKYQTNLETTVLNTTMEEAWAFWRGTLITDFLEPTDRIPAIDTIDVLEGPWGEPGSIRRVNLVGGGSTLERVLTSTESEFTYQIWNIETSSGRFIDHIYGKFEASPVDGGTQIAWSYNIKASAFYARPFIASFLKNDFAPFMQGGMEGMTAEFMSRNSN